MIMTRYQRQLAVIATATLFGFWAGAMTFLIARSAPAPDVVHNTTCIPKQQELRL